MIACWFRRWKRKMLRGIKLAEIKFGILTRMHWTSFDTNIKNRSLKQRKSEFINIFNKRYIINWWNKIIDSVLFRGKMGVDEDKCVKYYFKAILNSFFTTLHVIAFKLAVPGWKIVQLSEYEWYILRLYTKIK